jgi:hypothetical protein
MTNEMFFLQNEVYGISPTECFLRYLTYPEDYNVPVDLRQCAVVIMSHLDRLCQSYLPPNNSQKVKLCIRLQCPCISPTVCHSYNVPFRSHLSVLSSSKQLSRDHHGQDRMVVGFTTTYAINSYHH